MSNHGVLIERSGAVAVITIDRPEKLNAIGLLTMDAFEAALSEVEDSEARVLVITGAGDRVFVSGGDLEELAAVRTFEDAVAMAEKMRNVLDHVATLPIPVIAAMNGAAFGGGAEVSVACDVRVAAHDVRCAFNQVSIGIMPAWGGIERLTALVGRGRALLLMTSGKSVTAQEAFQLGLFDEVAEREVFADRWRELAQQIAKGPRDALIGIKAAQRAAFPAAFPALSSDATASFARTWVADAHWQMVEEATAARRASKSANSSSQ